MTASWYHRLVIMHPTFLDPSDAMPRCARTYPRHHTVSH